MTNRDLKRIVTIGPVYPFRGGIAQYGGLLIQELEKRYEVSSISYSLMYPKLLYPGKTQKDYSATNVVKNDIQYILNTINPFTYIKTARYINKYNPELVIIHWWHPYFSIVDWMTMKLIKREIKVCICCNNVMPHDKIPFSKFLTKMVLKCGKMFIVHSEEEEKQLFNLVGTNVAYIKILCPNVSTFVNTGMTQKVARERLNLEKEQKVLLFFGFVRKYKGLYHIINIMPELKKRLDNFKLLIVGDFYDDKEKYDLQIKELNLEEDLKVYSEFIPDAEVEPYFAASDAVILPYDSATTSGVIQAAYFFNKPVIVTNVGGLSEAVVHGKTGYVVEADNEQALCQQIIDFFENERSIDYKKYIDEERYKYSWERVVDMIQEMWDSYESK